MSTKKPKGPRPKQVHSGQQFRVLSKAERERLDRRQTKAALGELGQLYDQLVAFVNAIVNRMNGQARIIETLQFRLEFMGSHLTRNMGTEETAKFLLLQEEYVAQSVREQEERRRAAAEAAAAEVPEVESAPETAAETPSDDGETAETRETPAGE